jgi:hypothetical protein
VSITLDFRWLLLQISFFGAGIAALTALRRAVDIYRGRVEEIPHFMLDTGIAGLVGLLGWLVYLSPGPVPKTWYAFAYIISVTLIIAGLIGVLIVERARNDEKRRKKRYEDARRKKALHG